MSIRNPRMTPAQAARWLTGPVGPAREYENRPWWPAWIAGQRRQWIDFMRDATEPGTLQGPAWLDLGMTFAKCGGIRRRWTVTRRDCYVLLHNAEQAEGKDRLPYACHERWQEAARVLRRPRRRMRSTLTDRNNADAFPGSEVTP